MLLCVLIEITQVRGTLRKWNRYYFVLKPGLLLIYKTDKTHKVRFHCFLGRVLSHSLRYGSHYTSVSHIAFTPAESLALK